MQFFVLGGSKVLSLIADSHERRGGPWHSDKNWPIIGFLWGQFTCTCLLPGFLFLHRTVNEKIQLWNGTWDLKFTLRHNLSWMLHDRGCGCLIISRGSTFRACVKPQEPQLLPSFRRIYLHLDEEEAFSKKNFQNLIKKAEDLKLKIVDIKIDKFWGKFISWTFVRYLLGVHLALSDEFVSVHVHMHVV